MPMIPSLAIDFGNTRTKVAYYDEGRGEPRLVKGLGTQSREILPSLFFIEREVADSQSEPHEVIPIHSGGQVRNHRIFFGDDARCYEKGDPTSLIHRSKLDISKATPHRLLGGRKIARRELVASQVRVGQQRLRERLKVEIEAACPDVPPMFFLLQICLFFPLQAILLTFVFLLPLIFFLSQRQMFHCFL